MEYDKMTLLELRNHAKQMGYRGLTGLKKQDLIARLEELEGGRDQADPAVSEPDSKSDPADKKSSGGRLNQQNRRENGNRENSDGRQNRRESGNREDNDGRQNRREGGSRADRRNYSERRESGARAERRDNSENEDSSAEMKPELANLDSGTKANGILEVMPDNYGFIRCENYLPGENDVYVSPSQIRRFNLKTGDILSGNIRIKTQNEKYSALLYVESVNGYKPYEAQRRKNFEDLTPIFPNEIIRLETEGAPVSMRMVDLLSPIGKGQRGMIVSQPKTGKTTLLKQIARSITKTQPDMKVIVLLIDERPEEVTDIRESIEGPNAEVIYSTFDELPDHHRRVSEMVLERAKRLVEHKQDVVILLDSITRLARAYNLIVPPSGRTLSGGLDPAALHMPKKFFGSARNMREGGSLTILATALVETGSKMDDVVFEEFKGTGNMELVLDRKLSEKRIFPAINIQKSGTRRDDLLLTKEEREVVYALHREMSGARADENMEQILNMFKKTKNNQQFIEVMKQSLRL